MKDIVDRLRGVCGMSLFANSVARNEEIEDQRDCAAREIETLRARVAELEREVEMLTAERDRYKAWHDEVMAQKVVDAVDIGTACYAMRRQNGRVIELQDAIDEIERASVKAIRRPQPLKENE